MLDFKVCKDSQTNMPYVLTSLCGKPLLTTPQLNKGTAFSYEERRQFQLMGKLPVQIETLDEQVVRAYRQFCGYTTKLQKNIYLNNLHDKNQILFYKLVGKHLAEMLPTIYTPIVGTAVKQFSLEFRQPRGIYIAYPDIDHIDEILDNRSNPEIDLIVVTDGEGVLGIGDQGIGGMDIPVAKLMVYSLCGGIDPTRTLPIFLDVGTNNLHLLQDPLYLGWRNRRISGAPFDDFIAKFVAAIKHKFPHTFLHWEDFGAGNARRILDSYKDKLCTFNDDIQGTGAVALAALLAAGNVTGTPLTEQRIVVYGAGSAGTGICDQIVAAMCLQGLTPQEAYQRFWLIDRQGLLVADDTSLSKGQLPFARSRQEVQQWYSAEAAISLLDTINHVKPTVLIGTSSQFGAFSQPIVSAMAHHCQRPIIFPLSNPTENCEAQPADIIAWSQGSALIATGTKFEPVNFNERLIEIAQCNNALVFPGIGLGILSVTATHLSDGMLLAACHALSKHCPTLQNNAAPLLPSLDEACDVAKYIAQAVAQQAIDEGLAFTNLNQDLTQVIDAMFWQPRYLPFRRKML